MCALFRIFNVSSYISLIFTFYARHGGSSSLNGFQILALRVGDDPAETGRLGRDEDSTAF